MDEWAAVAERRIAEALARGELAGLPGEGRPLVLDDDALVTPELRLAHRILSNAGFVPEPVRLRREIATLEPLMRAATGSGERARIARRIDGLRAVLDARGGGHRWPGAGRGARASVLGI